MLASVCMQTSQLYVMCTSNASSVFHFGSLFFCCQGPDEWRQVATALYACFTKSGKRGSMKATDYLASFCMLRWGVVREDLRDIFWAQ
jgi:hypothetical protein